MEAFVDDLRYRIKDVFKALERGETVKILCRGKVKGTIVPASEGQKLRIVDHPFFGMKAEEKKSVPEVMNDHRGRRHLAC